MKCYLKALFEIFGWILFGSLFLAAVGGFWIGVFYGVEYLSINFYPMLPIHILLFIMGLLVLFLIYFCLEISAGKLYSYEEYLGERITYKKYLKILFTSESAIGNSKRTVLDYHTNKFKLGLMSLTNPLAILLVSGLIIAGSVGIVYLWMTYTTIVSIIVGVVVFIAIWIATAKEICKKIKEKK